MWAVFAVDTEATEKLLHGCSYQSLNLILLHSAHICQSTAPGENPTFYIFLSCLPLVFFRFVHWKKGGRRGYHRHSFNDGLSVFSSELNQWAATNCIDLYNRVSQLTIKTRNIFFSILSYCYSSVGLDQFLPLFFSLTFFVQHTVLYFWRCSDPVVTLPSWGNPVMVSSYRKLMADYVCRNTFTLCTF